MADDVVRLDDFLSSMDRTGPVPLAEWMEEFLSLARRLSPLTQDDTISA